VSSGVAEDSCVYGEQSKLRFARYSLGGSYRYAIAFPHKQLFYEVRGLCDSSNCIYSSAADMFINYRALYFGQTIQLFTEFSTHLERMTDVTTGGVYYRLSKIGTPDFVLRDNDSYYSVKSAAFSSNGKWLGVEMPGYGVARINTTSFEVRQVIAKGEHYDDQGGVYELAVSNDGEQLALLGIGVEPSLVTISGTCGRVVRSGMASTFSSDETPCSAITLASLKNLPDYDYSSSPQFNGKGDRLSFVKHSNSNPPERIVLAPSTGDISSQRLYIALGDSFTSGEGELDDAFYRTGTNTGSNNCHTSTRSYPYLVGQHWSIPVQNIACSGARTIDILGSPNATKPGHTESNVNEFTPGNGAQIEYVSAYQPEVVSVGIGGNDAGLMAKLSACLSLGTCEWVEDPAKRYATALEIKSVYRKVSDVIGALKVSSPSSRIVVVGYPFAVDSSQSASCDVVTGALLNYEERIFITESIRYLNRVLMAVATANRVNYANIESSFLDKTLCGYAGSAAMNGLRFGNDIAPFEALSKFRIFGSESFHPTPYGHQRMANDFISYFPTAELQVFCQTCQVIDDVPTPPPYWGSAGQEHAQQLEQPSMSAPVIEIGKTLSLLLDTLTFAANTELSVEIHSEPVELGVVRSDSNGGYAGEFTVPSSLNPGYHVLHVLGIGPDGLPVDVYRTIALVSPQDEVKAGHGDNSATLIQNADSTPSSGAANSSNIVNYPVRTYWPAQSSLLSNTFSHSDGEVLGVSAPARNIEEGRPAFSKDLASVSLKFYTTLAIIFIVIVFAVAVLITIYLARKARAL
jgi:hypothetical protein